MKTSAFGMRNRRIIPVLVVAGLVSAVITILFLWHSIFLIFSGFVFGLIIAACLGKLGVFTQRQSGWFIAVAAAAHFFSFYLVLFLQDSLLPMSNRGTDSPLAFLAGGALGGLLVVGALPLVLDKRTSKRDTLIDALPWAAAGAALGGGLAVIGILFGPTLGAGAVELLRVLHLLPFHGNARMRPPDDWYSLYLIWQTGIALMLGIIVRRYIVTNRIAEAERK